MYTKQFSQLSQIDSHVAGGKGSSLGEMTNTGIPVPKGFVILSNAFQDFCKQNNLNVEIDAALEKANKEDVNSIELASEKIQELILSSNFSNKLVQEIKENFKQLDTSFVAVRSSATVEDGKDHAWAGQLNSYLNTTKENLLENVKKCFASLFTPRAISYRIQNNLHKTNISVAVVVQKMVQSEISGIAFSVHPVTEDRNQIIIEVGYGLGEAIVSGQITPDSYVVHKNNLEIIDKNISTQTKGIFRHDWKEIEKEKQNLQKLSDVQIKELSKLIIKIENHYGFPCDIEWAYEGGKFYITQSRPITTLKNNLQTESKKDITHLYKTQISLTEWFEKIKHKDTDKIKKEDNSKRDRLAVLNKIIKLPYDKPTRFEVVDILNMSSHFKKYLDKHGKELCALRLLPKKTNLPKLRMRGHTVKDVTHNWLKEQKINPSDYTAEYVGHSDKTYYSTIFVINKKGIFGEVTNSGHEKLTQGFYDKHKPVQFEYTFKDKKWLFSNKNKKDKAHIKKAVSKLYVKESAKRNQIQKQLRGKFSNNYLEGYFETTESKKFGLWFIDYNRLLPKYLNFKNNKNRKIKKEYVGKTDIQGIPVFPGKIVGKVKNLSEIDDIKNEKFLNTDILVCEMTTPEHIHIMQKVGGIVTDLGGILSHAAIISRELKKPCVVGATNSTKVLRSGDEVVVDALTGNIIRLNN